MLSALNITETGAAQSVAHQNVLILHSYHGGFPWTDSIQKGIMEELGNLEDVDLFVEYMDTKQTPPELLFPHLANIYELKYSYRDIDIILTSDDNAFDFAIGTRDVLFPDIPIVFCGVNNFSKNRLQGYTDITGVAEDVDFLKGTELILDIFPKTKTIAVISDITATGDLHKEKYEKDVISKLSDRVEFKKLYRLTAARLKDELERLPSNSAVFDLTFWRDPTGQTFNHRVSNTLITEASPVPVFTAWDHTIVYGILGGIATNGFLQGKTAAKMVKRILDGEKPSAIPVAEKSPNIPMFDYSVMQRFGVEKSQLPSNSIILNEPESFYYKYKSIVWLTIAFIILQMIAISLLILNIKKRKTAQTALIESENKFQTLVKNIPGTVYQFVFTRQGDFRFEYISENCIELFGYSAIDIKSDPKVVFDNIPQPDADKVKQKIMKSASTLTPYSVDQRFIKNDGKTIWLHASSIPRKLSNGDVIWDGVSLDITQRKQAEERLIEFEERFRLTFYTSPDAININKMDGTYLEINEGFIQLTGYTRKDAIGKTSTDINIWDIPEDRERLVEGLQKDGYVKNLESRFLMKDGSYKIALMSATIIQLQGEPHILSITRDITDLRKTEQEKLLLERQLQQAQKMESVGRLAGGVAHDFNNMLGVILGHAELAMEELDRDQPIFNDLQQILKAANRSTDITRQLLAFARKQIVSPKVIDLNETVTGMLKMLLRLIGEDVEFVWLPGKQLWPIKMDPSQIDQILVNLCVNARDALAGVGKITVETGICTLDEDYCSTHAGFVPGQYVKMEVSDNGSGMDRETMSYIFEPFYTTKAVNEGTGLGLATVYGIVKQNNGFINVYSELGQGTIFTIYLPRHLGKANQAQLKSQPEPVIRGNETILLVEDEPTILTMATTMLQRLGYTVLATDSPSKAIRLADEHSGEIHLLLTDVIMPEMHGRLLMEKLTVNRPELKCLFMSGYTANVISHQGVLDEGVNFIQKPFVKREIAAKIRIALEAG